MMTRNLIIIASSFALFGCDQATTVPTPSIATSPRSDWAHFRSEPGRFTVNMPVTPRVSTEPGRLFTTNIVSCDLGRTTFFVIYFDPPPQAIAPEVAERTMRNDRDMSIQKIQGTLKYEAKVTIQKDGQDWPGLASVIETSTNLYSTRLYAINGRMYSLQVDQPKNEDHSADIAKFFDSFTVSAPTPPLQNRPIILNKRK